LSGGNLALVARYNCLSPHSSIGTRLVVLANPPGGPSVPLHSPVSTVPG
jgi:hypothetical protein